MNQSMNESRMNECCHVAYIGGSDWMTYFCDLGKETFPKKH